jgi:hypothetical protein
VSREQFKSILKEAAQAIIKAEDGENSYLIKSFHEYYDDLASEVFPTQYPISRLNSIGFKLLVQQVISMICLNHNFEEDYTSEDQKRPFQEDGLYNLDNVIFLNDFKKKKDRTTNIFLEA